jgi:hypothetical protein
MHTRWCDETRSWRTAWWLLFVWLVLGANAGCDGAAVFACEESAARLAECCPGIKAEDIFCEDTGSAIDNEYTNAVSQEEASCILDKECSELIDEGICATKMDSPHAVACR